MERQRPERNSTHRGTLGWLAIAGFVAVWDRYASESLTHAAHRGLEHRVGKYAVPAALGITALHLLDKIPREIDPFYRVLDVSPRKVQETAVEMGIVTEQKML